MKPVVAAVVVGGLTVAGSYAAGKSPKIDHAIGVAGVAIGLGILDMMNPKLAEGFGILAVVATGLIHAKPIFDAVAGSASGSAGSQFKRPARESERSQNERGFRGIS